MTWLTYAGPSTSDAVTTTGVVLARPGSVPARGARRINGVLTAVHAVAAGQASGQLLPLLYEVAEDRELPEAARDSEGRMAGVCGPGIGCTSRSGRSIGPVTPTSSRCCGPVVRRETG